MQEAYVESMCQILEKDKDVICLLADSGTAYDEMMRRDYPNQCFNLGIAEENLVGVAAGLAQQGKKPFVYAQGAFLAYRAYEFIRNDVCMQELNVTLIGSASGMGVSTLGPSHHTTEDIGVLRSIPGLVLLSPASPMELRAMIEFAYTVPGAVYIRMGLDETYEVYDESYTFVFPCSHVVHEGDGLAIFTTGSVILEVEEACEILKKRGISPAVINVSSLKPFDRTSLHAFARKYPVWISVEEHNIYGGLGSILADAMTQERISHCLYRIGLADCFARGYGTHRQLRGQNGLDAASIAGACEKYYQEGGNRYGKN